MTRQDWIKQAEEWDAKAQTAYENDNLTFGEYCERSAQYCRRIANDASDEPTNLIGGETCNYH